MGFLASPKVCKAVEFVNGTTLAGLLPGNASDVLTEPNGRDQNQQLVY
jgi:hypothetical protein